VTNDNSEHIKIILQLLIEMPCHVMTLKDLM